MIYVAVFCFKAIGKFEWIIINLLKSAAFSLQTSENNIKPL